ncbi:MAG TPA: hypothetical protein GX704_06910 [Clostridiales bacterium]|nr:hypothetical protein [Clostridiales bacterium]
MNKRCSWNAEYPLSRDFSKIPLDKFLRKWYNVLHAGVAELVDAHV